MFRELSLWRSDERIGHFVISISNEKKIFLLLSPCVNPNVCSMVVKYSFHTKREKWVKEKGIIDTAIAAYNLFGIL